MMRISTNPTMSTGVNTEPVHNTDEMVAVTGSIVARSVARIDAHDARHEQPERDHRAHNHREGHEPPAARVEMRHVLPWFDERQQYESGNEESKAVEGEIAVAGDEPHRNDGEAGAGECVHKAPEQAGQRHRQRAQLAAGGQQPHAHERQGDADHLAFRGPALRPHAHIDEHHEQIHRLQHGSGARVRPMDREQVGHLHERHAGERRAHELRVFTPAGHRRPERVRCADHGGHEEDDPRDDLAHTGDPQRSRVVFLHEDLRHRAIDAPACAADEHACNADGHFPRRLLEGGRLLSFARHRLLDEHVARISLLGGRRPRQHLMEFLRRIHIACAVVVLWIAVFRHRGSFRSSLARIVSRRP